jgi:hypothetical protein
LHLYEISRIGIATEIESRLWLPEAGGMKNDWLIDVGFSFG